MKHFISVFLVMIFSGHVAAETAYEKASEMAWDLVVGKESVEQPESVSNVKQAAEAARKARTDRAKDLFTRTESIGQTTKQNLADMMGAGQSEFTKSDVTDKYKQPGTTYLFISLGMPEMALNQLFSRYSTTNPPDNFKVVIRGLLPDHRTIPDLYREVWERMAEGGYKPQLNIELDPFAFREFDIETVPQMVRILDDGRVMRVKGLTNPKFLANADPEQGLDLGTKGQVYPIEEIDLIQIIQQRIAQVDWETKRRNAIDSFWRNYKYEALPSAREPKKYDTDLRVFVSRDIPDGKGGFVARKGELINPFKNIDAANIVFNRRLIAFNPNQPEQIEFAKAEVQRALANNERPIPMVSDALKTDPTSTLMKMEEELKTQVFLLVPEVVERFNLKEVPATITRNTNKTASMNVHIFGCDPIKGVCKGVKNEGV